MKKKDIAISIKNLTKYYVLKHEKPTFIEQLFNKFKSENFQALDNISLEILKGEKVGIIGKNGSGKTTLLKLISKISSPNQGHISTNGKIVSLIDLTAGFHPDLSGADNIFLNGLIIGMNKKDVQYKYNNIIKFADIGDFISSPLHTYSEGMKLRLSFSVAIHSEPDILVLDEGILTGDVDFQEKSGKKIEQFFKKNKTVIIATHISEYLEAHCNRIIWIDNGKIKMDGGLEVINEYNESFN